jgi:hypothetical protein
MYSTFDGHNDSLGTTIGGEQLPRTQAAARVLIILSAVHLGITGGSMYVTRIFTLRASYSCSIY